MAHSTDTKAQQAEVLAILLASDSPARKLKDFTGLFTQLEDLTQQQKDVEAREQLLQSVLPTLEEAERTFADAEKQLAQEKSTLADYAGELGKAAFDALRAGEITDGAIFADRKELQGRIDDLQKRKQALGASQQSSVLEKAKTQAQILALTGQLKLEEFKAGAANKALGAALLASKNLAPVRCSSTEPLLKAIVQQNKRVNASTTQLKEATDSSSKCSEEVAKQIGHSGSLTADALRSEIAAARKQISACGKALGTTHREMLLKAMASDQLKAKIPALCHIVVTEESMPAAGDQIKRMSSHLAATMRKYCPPRAIAAVSFAGLVLLGIYIIWPWHSDTAKKMLSDGESIVVARKVLRPNGTTYTERGFRELTFGASEADVQAVLRRQDESTPKPVRLFFNDGKLKGMRYRYVADNEQYLRLLKEMLGPAARENMSTSVSSTSMTSPDPASLWTGEWRQQRVGRGVTSFFMRYYFPETIVYGLASWVSDTRDPGVREEMNVVFWEREWLESQLAIHARHCLDVCTWVRDDVLPNSDDAQLAKKLEYKGQSFEAKEQRTSRKPSPPDALKLFSEDKTAGSPAKQLEALQEQLEQLTRLAYSIAELEKTIKEILANGRTPDPIYDHEIKENRAKMAEIEARRASLMKVMGLDPSKPKDIAEFEERVGAHGLLACQEIFLAGTSQNSTGILIEKYLLDMADHKQGEFLLRVDLSRLPTGHKEFYARLGDYNCGVDADLCAVQIAQQVFPPSSSKVRVTKRANSHFSLYSWEWGNKWQVSVGNSGELYFSNRPPKAL